MTRCEAYISTNNQCRRTQLHGSNFCTTHGERNHSYVKVFLSQLFHKHPGLCVNRPRSLLSFGTCSTYVNVIANVERFVNELSPKKIEFVDNLRSTLCDLVTHALFVFDDCNVVKARDIDADLDLLFFPGQKSISVYLLTHTVPIQIRTQEVDYKGKKRQWDVLVKRKVRINYMVLVFDLEWSQHVFSERFTSGFIVDHHFEVLGQNLVVSTGTLHAPGKLTQFLIDQGYTQDLIEDSPDFTTMPLALQEMNSICDRVTFMAFNGKSSDIHVLESAGIVVKEYLDACSILSPHAFYTQAFIYFKEFGYNPTQTHWARDDTVNLLAILQNRGIDDGHVRAMLLSYQTMNTDLSFKNLYRHRRPCDKPIHRVVCCFDCV